MPTRDGWLPTSPRTALEARGAEAPASRQRFDAIHLDGIAVHIQLADYFHLLAHILFGLPRFTEFVADFRHRILQDKLSVLLHDPATKSLSFVRRDIARGRHLSLALLRLWRDGRIRLMRARWSRVLICLLRLHRRIHREWKNSDGHA